MLAVMTTYADTGRTIPAMPSDGLTTITDQQRTAARRTVAQHAVDAEDAAQLMLALGLFPGQELEGFQTPDAYRFQWCM
jgi:hypothetical protein